MHKQMVIGGQISRRIIYTEDVAALVSGMKSSKRASSIASRNIHIKI